MKIFPNTCNRTTLQSLMIVGKVSENCSVAQLPVSPRYPKDNLFLTVYGSTPLVISKRVQSSVECRDSRPSELDHSAQIQLPVHLSLPFSCFHPSTFLTPSSSVFILTSLNFSLLGNSICTFPTTATCISTSPSSNSNT